MSAPAGLIDQPADRGARRLALAHLDAAAAACARLDAGDDEAAIHDFRVALRRLRSAARAYRDPLSGSLTRKDRRRLADLAESTGDARDLEVHAAWLQSRLDGLPDEARSVADELLGELRPRLEKARAAVRKEVAKDFPRERWRLARRLRFYRVEVDLDQPAGGPALSTVGSRLVLDAAAELERALAEVRTVDDQDEAHRTRIAAKRLRYLLEPFAADVEAIPPLIKRLKQLQDALGEMHDADVLLSLLAHRKPEKREDEGDGDGDADAEAGIRALFVAIESERARHFAAAEAWLHGRAAGFFAEVRAAARELAARGRPDLEIERKYLLKRMPAIRSLPYVVEELDQGYLPGDRLVERVRRVRRDGEVRYYRTVKLGKGISRIEVEEETTAAVFRRLWPLTRGKRVRKRRYKVQEDGFTWEIDRFRDRRLVLCEVELPSEDTEAPPPRWLRREIVRDVTDEPEFLNMNLAK